jgi:hypothetical protein
MRFTRFSFKWEPLWMLAPTGLGLLLFVVLMLIR